MSDNNHQLDLATQIENLYQSGEYVEALEVSDRTLESNPADLEAYSSRWKLIANMFSEACAKKRISSEIESFCRTHPETPEVLETAYWGNRILSDDAENIPRSLFEKMLQYPRTRGFQIALLEIAKQSKDVRQKWLYHQHHIDAYTVSDAPEPSWYLLAHEEMLWLVEENRTLVSDDLLDEFLDRFLKAYLSYYQDTQQCFLRAYTKTVEQRLKLNVRLDKALEILDHAQIKLGEEAVHGLFVEHSKDSVKDAHKNILRMRSEIYFRQGQWRKAHDGLAANTPDFLKSLWARFNENTINYFWMLGRSAEGIGEWEKARSYYAAAYFVPTPHVKGLAGLERISHQIEPGTTDTFEIFLKDTEAEYRIREVADREKIRRTLIMNRLNKKAMDFRLETLEGETYTLSTMSEKVILLEVGTSWCGPCNDVIPEVEIVYDRFSNVDDVVVWGINDGETRQQVRKFLDEHQPPWPILLDPRQEVRQAYQIEGIPFFILIDKAGIWQYSFISSHLISGQPLIWQIEALLSD